MYWTEPGQTISTPIQGTIPYQTQITYRFFQQSHMGISADHIPSYGCLLGTALRFVRNRNIEKRHWSWASESVFT
jgi:hypothetical protein